MSDHTSPATASSVPPAATTVTASASTQDPSVDRYLATVRQYKLRRLYGLLVLSGMLLFPLITIYAEGWWKLTGTGAVGAGWVFVGIGVVVAAITAVVVDLLYRKEL